MIYTELVKKACLITFEAHKNDVDKGGYPYVFHPFYLATQMDDENSVCVALLHDVIEDHGDVYDLEYLRREGFPDEVLRALALMTHEKDVPYMDYVKKLAKDPFAAKVKLADLKHNSDAARTGGTAPKKREVYEQAIKYLTEKE